MYHLTFLQMALRISPDLLQKSASWCLDIVSGSSTTSACFTKSYSRYLKGTGSVLLVDECADNACRGSTSTCGSGDSAVETGAGIAHPCSTDSNELTRSGGGATCDEFQSAPNERSFDGSWAARLGDHRHLRYFAPSEIALLFGFPSSFRFPIGMSNKKCFELLGNSLNVTVASNLLISLFQHHVEITAT
jgi:tRNA (cytosine38-C5)-methyltransferase